MDIEMRHLRALVTPAEELNLTRAGERLHLTARRSDDDRPPVVAFLEATTAALGADS